MYQIKAFNILGECIEMVHFMSKPTASQIKTFKRQVVKRFNLIPMVRVARIEKKYSEVA